MAYDVEVNYSEGRSARPAERGRKFVGAYTEHEQEKVKV